MFLSLRGTNAIRSSQAWCGGHNLATHCRTRVFLYLCLHVLYKSESLFLTVIGHNYEFALGSLVCLVEPSCEFELPRSRRRWQSEESNDDEDEEEVEEERNKIQSRLEYPRS